MFTGTKIYQLIEDADYDAVEDPVDRDKLDDLFFKKGLPSIAAIVVDAFW